MHCDKEEGFGGKEVMSEVMFDEATHIRSTEEN